MTNIGNRHRIILPLVMLLMLAVHLPALAQHSETPPVSTSPSQTVGVATRPIKSPAQLTKRVALVIGNSAYTHAGRLSNPSSDAKAVSASLTRLGFDVTTLTDLGRSDLLGALADFSDRAIGADIGVVFFAGHGMEVDRQNYLIPVDARLTTDNRVRFETIPLEDVMASLDGVTRLRMVLLDACRDNPFLSTMRRVSATRSIGRGLARVEPTVGTLVSFAAKAGTTADDGAGSHSPYTAALLTHIEEAGLEVNFLFRRVRDRVVAATSGRQEPFTYGSLPAQPIYFKPSDHSPAESRPAPSIADDFSLTAEVGTLAAWKAFLEKHADSGDALYIALARERHSALRLRQMAADRPSEAPESASAASALNSTPDLEQTASTETAIEQESGALVDLDLEARRDVQLALAQLGHDPGPADGQFGPRTRQAISAAREKLDLPPGTHIDVALLRRLPDPTAVKDLSSGDARKYSLSDLPPNADPRLRNAIKVLNRYALKFGYHDGHLYIAVLSWGLDWNSAKRLAERAGGHLVTISSRAENNFAYRLFADDDRFVRVGNDGQKKGPWIGL